MYQQLENTINFYKILSIYGVTDLWNIDKFCAAQIMKCIQLLVTLLFKGVQHFLFRFWRF